MQYAYPCLLKSEEDSVSVSFPDIPEALTYGTDRPNALAQKRQARAYQAQSVILI